MTAGFAAIVSADAVTYTRPMEWDEVGTHARFKAQIDPKIGELACLLETVFWRNF